MGIYSRTALGATAPERVCWAQLRRRRAGGETPPASSGVLAAVSVAPPSPCLHVASLCVLSASDLSVLSYKDTRHWMWGPPGNESPLTVLNFISSVWTLF